MGPNTNNSATRNRIPTNMSYSASWNAPVAGTGPCQGVGITSGWAALELYMVYILFEVVFWNCICFANHVGAHFTDI